MRFLSGEKLSGVLRDVVTGERIDAAVAYWGAGAIEFLGLDKAAAGSRIVCDAYSGACNPKILQCLLDSKFEVFNRPGLHAKVYICGDTLIVGSANASANGLGREDLEIDLGLEAAIITEDPIAVKSARSWFEKMVDPNSKLKPSDIDKIRKVWLKHRNDRPNSKNAKMTLEDAILTNDPLLADRRFFLAIYQPVKTPKKMELKYKESPYYKKDTYTPNNIPFFWDAQKWGAQKGDVLLSYEVESGKVILDNLWLVQAVIDGGELLPVEPIKQLFGLKFTKKQGHSLGKLVNVFLKEECIKPPNELIPICDFADMLAKNKNKSEVLTTLTKN